MVMFIPVRNETGPGESPSHGAGGAAHQRPAGLRRLEGEATLISHFITGPGQLV